MYKSKLFQILRAFDDNEWQDFRNFLVYKNHRNSKTLHLYDYIKKNSHDLSSKKFQIDEARTSIKLGLMSKKSLQNIMSKLTIIIEEYLVIQSVLNDPLETDFRIFQNYNDRNLYGLADKKANSLKEKWNNSNELDLKRINTLLRVQHSLFFSENPKKKDKGNLVLETLFTSFNDFCHIYNELYSYAIEKHISIKLSEANAFQNTALSDSVLTKEISKILSNINLLNQKSDSNSFQYLYKKLNSNTEMSSELRSLIFGVCETYLVNLIAKGETKNHADNTLNLYRLGLNTGLILFNNSLSSIKFQNILSIACLLKEFEWANDYVNTYIDLIPKKEREENLVLAQVQIYFAKWQYEDALNLLNTSESNNFLVKVQSRCYALVIYFIIFDNIDFFESQRNSFTQFFYYNKKRISQRNLDGSLNLAKIFKSAISYNKDFDLKSEIDKYDNIIFKNRLESIFEQRKIYKEQNGIDL